MHSNPRQVHPIVLAWLQPLANGALPGTSQLGNNKNGRKKIPVGKRGLTDTLLLLVLWRRSRRGPAAEEKAMNRRAAERAREREKLPQTPNDR